MTRDYIKFYRNFYEAINNLGEKSQLLLYKSVMELYFNRCENVTELEQLCAKIESKLERKRNVFGTFLALKPLIMKSAKAYLQAGLEGPEKEEKKEPTRGGIKNKEERIKNKEEKEKINKKEKKVTLDPFCNQTKNLFLREYEKKFGVTPYLSRDECLKLVELSVDINNFENLIPEALARLKLLEFPDIDFKPTANWLLKANNFVRLLNGEFERKKRKTDKQTEDIDGWSL